MAWPVSIAQIGAAIGRKFSCALLTSVTRNETLCRCFQPSGDWLANYAAFNGEIGREPCIAVSDARLRQVDDQALRDLGMISAGHWLRIRTAIAKLAPAPVTEVKFSATTPRACTYGIPIHNAGRAGNRGKSKRRFKTTPVLG